MRTPGSQTVLQGFRGEGRGDVHPGDRGEHACDSEPDTLPDVLVRQLRAHTGPREVPGAAGAAVPAGRGRSGLPTAGNGHPRLPSR